MKQIVSVLCILLFLVSALTPLACASMPAPRGTNNIPRTVTFQSQETANPRDLGTRAPADDTSLGGSWTESFDKGTTGSMYRTALLDNKVQLDTDQTSFTKYYNNPIILPNPGHFDSSGARMNCMLYENGTYRLWYSGTDGSTYRIGYAISSDGRNFTRQNGSNPVLPLGGAGTWDSSNDYGCFVIKEGNTYKMWYTGHNNQLAKIGLATSTDGSFWTLNANNPVLKNAGVGGGAWDANHVLIGSVIKDGNTYKMWFTGNNGNGNAGSQIGYATSNNGVAWNKFANNPIMALGVNGKFNSVANSDPIVWKVGDWYYMLFLGYNGANFAAGAAESRDGTTWTILNNGNAVLSPGTSGSWDDTHILELSLARIGYRNLLYYGGCSGATCRIGLAVGSSFATTGYLISDSIKLPDGMNWDQISLKTEEPAGTSIKITVLNDSTNKAINGYDNITGNNIDLSKLNAKAHNALRIMAVFSGTATASPALFSWGVSWVNATAWRDSFIGTGHLSVIDNSSLRLWDGALKLEANPLVWWKDAGNPVITYGSSGQWDQSKAADPTFITYSGKYGILYTGLSGVTDKIGLASSPDLKAWTKDVNNPVLSPTGGQFDQNGVRQADIKELDQTVKMFYDGKGASTGIGYAYGTDLVNWNKYAKNPVLTPSGAGWDNVEVQDPNVLRVNGTWYLYFAGNTTGGGFRIGYATSLDGGYFYVKPGSNKILDVGASGNFDDQSVKSPSVLFDKDRFLMFYVGVDGATSTGKIGLATSTDAKTWTKLNGGNPIISTGSGWDSTHISSVTAAYVNDAYEVYYSGDDGGGKPQIGHATSGRYTSATIVSKEIDLPGNGLWTGLYVNKNEPSGTYINVSVINATSGAVVPGFSDLTGKTINISTIDFNSYPKIKLKATLQGDGKATPTLNDWAVNWTIAKVVQKTLIPNKSFSEEGTALALYDLTQYFSSKRFSNKTLNYTVKSNSDPVNILVTMDADGYHLSFKAPTVNWTGSADYTINVTDGFMNLTSNKFNVTVLNVNDPPVWLKLPDVHVLENGVGKDLLILGNYVIDSDTKISDCTFSAINPDPTNLSVTINAQRGLDATPSANWSGMVKVILKVNDGQYTANQTVKIFVDFVEQAPVWIPFGPIHLTENQAAVRIINVETYARDAETLANLMNYSAQDSPGALHIVIAADHWLSFYPAANYSGTLNVKFYVNDGHYNVSTIVQIIVDHVNQAPFWRPMPVFNMTEDQKAVDLLNLETYVVDAETPSSKLTYNIEGVLPASAEVVMDEKHNLNVTAGSHYHGPLVVTISASDGQLTSYTNLTINVLRVNYPPIITSTPVKTCEATVAYSYQVTAIDIEGTPLTYSLLSFINGMTLGATTGLLQWTPTETQTGSFEVKISVSDGEAAVMQDYYLDVSPKPSGNNNPPVITSEPVTSAVVGQPYSYLVLAVDADKDPLTYSLNVKMGGMTIKSQSGQIDWTPQDGTEGSHPIVVAVNDGKVQVTQSFDLVVYPKGTIINNPPVITSTPITKALVGNDYKYKVLASDKDGDKLTFSLFTAPNGMTLDPYLGLIQWTPAQMDVGIQHVVIKVTDGKANATQAYNLLVGNENHPPSILSTAPKEAIVGTAYVYQMTSSDPDSDTVTYGITSGPQGMVIDASTGRMIWIPTKADVGRKTVTVFVTDGLVRINQTFDIKIKEKGSSTSLGGMQTYLWVLIVVILVLGMALVAVVIARRRPKAPDYETAPPSAAPYPPSESRASPSTRPQPPSREYDQMEQRIISSPPKRPVHHEIKGVVDEALADMTKAPAAPQAVAPAPKVQAQNSEVERQPSPPSPADKAPQTEKSTNDLLDELLGKAPAPVEEEKPTKAKAVLAKEVPKAEAKPVLEERLSVEIEGSSYTKEQILHTLTSLPRGLPSTLWGKDMDELSSDIVNADYSHNPEGEVIVKLGKRWYFGDPQDIGTYMQQYKGG